MRLDPGSEVSYRARMARRYLEDAGRAYARKDYRLTVASSQLSAENSAKAIIAVFRTPSWSHDPSHELLELLPQLPEHVRDSAKELAKIARSLAPEHGRTTYGEPLRGLTPWDIYREEEASESLRRAKKAYELMNTILHELGVKMQ